MDYALTTVYNDLILRIKSNAQYFTDLGLEAPKNFHWFNGTYDQSDRPAIHLEFGQIDLEAAKGFTRKGLLPVTVHIVDNLHVEGREGDAQHDDFKEKLNYPFRVNALLEYWDGGSCFGPLALTGFEPDHNQDNLMVHKFTYQTKVTIKEDPDLDVNLLALENNGQNLLEVDP